MIKIYIVFTLSVLFNFALKAEVENKAMPKDKIEQLEKSVIEELNKRNPSKKEYHAIYNLAAREFYYLGYLKKSEEYYQKSVEVAVEVNKTEAFINLMAIAFTEKNMEKLKKQLNEANKYFNNNKKHKTVDVEMYLSSMTDVVENKISKGKVSFFSEYIRKGSFENVLKEKKYEEELLKYNIEKLLEADYASIVDYDLLNVLSRQKNVKKLFCEDQLQKYPDAFAPAIIICAMLSDYVNNRPVKEESFARLEKYFQDINGDRKYVLPYLRELK